MALVYLPTSWWLPSNGSTCHNINRMAMRRLYSDWLRAGRLRGRSSSTGRVKNFLFSKSSRPALGSTQPPIQWVPGVLSPGVKRPGREADHSHPASAEVKNSPIRLHGVMLNSLSTRTILLKYGMEMTQRTVKQWYLEGFHLHAIFSIIWLLRSSRVAQIHQEVLFYGTWQLCYCVHAANGPYSNTNEFHRQLHMLFT
jgi:hypothetical protein